MPFQISPGVNVSEIDLTTIIPAVSSTTGAFAGHFKWGPVGTRVLVDSEDTLVNNFSTPNTNTSSDFFTAANFLSYGNALYLVRVVRESNTGTRSTDTVTARNATGSTSNNKNTVIKNEEDYRLNHQAAGITGVGGWVAKYPGILGNSLRVSVCPSANAYESTISAFSYIGQYLTALPGVGTTVTKLSTSNTVTINAVSSATATAISSQLSVGDYIIFSDGISRKVNSVSTANSTGGSTYPAAGSGLASGRVVSVVLNNRPSSNGTQLVTSVSYGYTTRTSAITLTFTDTSKTVTSTANVATQLTVGDVLLAGPDYTPVQVAAISTSGLVITLKDAYSGNTVSQSNVQRRWEFHDNVSTAPGTSNDVARRGASGDEMHIVVVDEEGQITGYANTVLEVHEGLSKAFSARSENGSNIYYKDYINQMSRWIWWTAHPTGISIKIVSQVASGYNFNAGTSTPNRPINTSLTNGRDGSAPREADYLNGYGLFRSAEDVDVSLVLGGASTQTRATYIINNITEYRKDCVAVFSPLYASVVNNSLYAGSEQQAIITFRNLLPSSSYAIMDSAWKYQYDKYNDVYRYVPNNGDTAGLMVRTDTERDPWWSPAGYNRGGIKNVIKLSYNPPKADRDQLYKNGINPVCTFPGQGTILFGDKTMLSKPSAFDRINVRRLFIVLEKAIATAAKFTLFEFNDAFTRAQFKAMVEPFLRDVQGRRGITDFKVVCDETNNTGEVIDRNEFIGDIYIKPARSINFIQLNFVAVRTGVDFTEVVGKF